MDVLTTNRSHMWAHLILSTVCLLIGGAMIRYSWSLQPLMIASGAYVIAWSLIRLARAMRVYSTSLCELGLSQYVLTFQVKPWKRISAEWVDLFTLESRGDLRIITTREDRFVIDASSFASGVDVDQYVGDRIRAKISQGINRDIVQVRTSKILAVSCFMACFLVSGYSTWLLLTGEVFGQRVAGGVILLLPALLIGRLIEAFSVRLTVEGVEQMQTHRLGLLQKKVFISWSELDAVRRDGNVLHIIGGEKTVRINLSAFWNDEDARQFVYRRIRS